MKIRLNSLTIANKWRIKKQLFQSETKIFVAAYDQDSPACETTMILMVYDEAVEQLLCKTIGNCKKVTAKEGQQTRLLVPGKPCVQKLGNTKILAMPLVDKAISLSHMMKQKVYSFTDLEILQSAISGIASLSELHASNIVHGKLTPTSCYFFNREHKGNRKGSKNQLGTYFGVCVADADMFSVKSFGVEGKISQLLFQPVSKALGLKPAFKDDIESLLYILIKMSSRESIFSNNRYHKVWKTQQLVRKWKISQLYSQLLHNVSQSLSVLIELYLYLQECSPLERPDYGMMIKKLQREKDGLTARERDRLLQRRSVIVMEAEKEDSQCVSQLNHDHDDSLALIFEEDINLSVRKQETRINKYDILGFD